jgi:hypothetical protein
MYGGEASNQTLKDAADVSCVQGYDDTIKNSGEIRKLIGDIAGTANC